MAIQRDSTAGPQPSCGHALTGFGEQNSSSLTCLGQIIIGFLRGECPRGGGNWGTLRIPREDWGTLGNIREY